MSIDKKWIIKSIITKYALCCCQACRTEKNISNLKVNNPKTRKYLSNLQCVHNHYAKFEYKGMKTVRVTDYTNQTPSKPFGRKLSKIEKKMWMKWAQNKWCTSLLCEQSLYKVEYKEMKLLELQITQTRHPKILRMDGWTKKCLSLRPPMMKCAQDRCAALQQQNHFACCLNLFCWQNGYPGFCCC